MLQIASQANRMKQFEAIDNSSTAGPDVGASSKGNKFLIREKVVQINRFIGIKKAIIAF